MTNLLVLAGLAFAVESCSWAILRLRAPDPAADSSAAAPQHDAAYSDPGIPRDLARMNGPSSGYSYESHVTYLPNPYASRFVNVAADGHRLNAAPGVTAGKVKGAMRPRKLTVWIFGSSAVFGATNADDQTLAAYLETALREKNPDWDVTVVNYGVVGYSSLQDLLHLKLRLLSGAPDLVVLFNGVNDHYYAWQAEDARGAAVITGVMTRDTLRRYAELHQRGDIVNFMGLNSALLGLFSNTTELVEKARKYFSLRAANDDVLGWKVAYRARHQSELDTAKRVVPAMQEFYLENVRAFVALAKAHGARVVIAQQPLLFGTAKTLRGPEPGENDHPKLAFFALSESELTALDRVPSFRLKQTHYWDWDYFIESYRAQNVRLKALSSEIDASYLNAQAVADGAGEVPVFASAVHYTWRHLAREAGTRRSALWRRSTSRRW